MIKFKTEIKKRKAINKINTGSTETSSKNFLQPV